MVLNGRLPGAMLGTIPGTSRRVLLELVPQTAALRAAFAAHFGKPLVVTDAYRTYDEQVRLKAEKGPYAATPGTSNHGWGRALDLGSSVNAEGSPEYRWMKANAHRFGWVHPRWAEDRDPSNGQQEPWHWEALSVVPASNYTNTTGGTVPTAPPTTPIAPITPEDDMPLNDADKAWIKQTIAEAVLSQASLEAVDRVVASELDGRLRVRDGSKVPAIDAGVLLSQAGKEEIDRVVAQRMDERFRLIFAKLGIEV